VVGWRGRNPLARPWSVSTGSRSDVGVRRITINHLVCSFASPSVVDVGVKTDVGVRRITINHLVCSFASLSVVELG